MDQVLPGGTRRDPAGPDLVEPPLAEIDHVVAAETEEVLVPDQSDEVADGLAAGVLPAAKLVVALAEGPLAREATAELQRARDRDPRPGHGAKQGGGLVRVGPTRCWSGCLRSRMSATGSLATTRTSG